MKVLNHQSGNHGQQQNCCSEGVELNLGSGALNVACCESVESNSAELSGLTTRGAGAFAGANLTLVAKPVSLELGLVNGSAMVSAGCCGGPSANSLGRGHQGQRITNIDVVDQLPTQGVTNQGIGHGDAFIEDGDLGSNKDQVGANAYGYRPDRAANSVLQIVGKPKSNAHAGGHQIDDCCKNVAADRSKNLNVIHETIIAGNAAGDSAGRK